jgi:hypothetical protein
MHQQVEGVELMDKSSLITEKNELTKNYRNMVVWASRVLEYKRRFDREEDFGDDGLQDYIDILKGDSRRELRDIAIKIKLVRQKIDGIDNELMNMEASDGE